MIMSGHQERRSDGWERRQASVLRCHLGALAAAAALAAGLVGAANASGAELQAGRAGNVAPIGGANTRDDPTAPNRLLVRVNKARSAYLGGTVRLKLLISSDDDEFLPNAQTLITPEVGSLAELIFVKGPVAETPGKVYVGKDRSTVIGWYIYKAPPIFEPPATLSMQLKIPEDYTEEKLCLRILAWAKDTEDPTSSTACWDVPETTQKPQKTEVVKSRSPRPKPLNHAPKDYQYKSEG